MNDWSHRLRALREGSRVTRAELAHAAGVGATSIKAYEAGARHPSRPVLTALLDSLKADLFTRREVLMAAGYAPDLVTPSGRRPDEYFTLEEACEEAARSPIPVCVSTEVMEVVGANVLVQRLWGVDLNREMDGPFERSMMSMLSTPRIGDRLANWDEAVSLTISVVKGHYGGEDALTKGGHPYFAAAIQHFLQGEPRYVQRFLMLWSSVEGQQRKIRFAYPVVWDHLELGRLNFHVLLNPADERGGLLFNDYVPLDGHTAAAVEELRARADGLQPFTARTWSA